MTTDFAWKPCRHSSSAPLTAQCRNVVGRIPDQMVGLPASHAGSDSIIVDSSAVCQFRSLIFYSDAVSTTRRLVTTTLLAGTSAFLRSDQGVKVEMGLLNLVYSLAESIADRDIQQIFQNIGEILDLKTRLSSFPNGHELRDFQARWSWFVRPFEGGNKVYSGRLKVSAQGLSAHAIVTTENPTGETPECRADTVRMLPCCPAAVLSPTPSKQMGKKQATARWRPAWNRRRRRTRPRREAPGRRAWPWPCRNARAADAPGNRG